MDDVVSTPTDQAADETAIGELLRRQQNGWDSGDPTLYADVFTADADYVSFLGSHHEGRDAIAASYAPPFRKLLQGSRLSIEVKQVRFLTPDVALIHAAAAVTKRGRRSRRPSRINTSVAQRTNDGWMLAASQNTTRRRLTETLLQKLTSRDKNRATRFLEIRDGLAGRLSLGLRCAVSRDGAGVASRARVGSCRFLRHAGWVDFSHL